MPTCNALRLIGTGVLAVIAIAATVAVLAAAPVDVRLAEGAAHGFLVLRDTSGAALAQGDWWQAPRRDKNEAHLRFRFKDGSLAEETFVFAQSRVFTLVEYRAVQRGPSFPREIEASIDRSTRRYTVRVRERAGEPEKVEDGEMDLPDDLYPVTMLAVLLRNLPRGEGTAVQTVVFTPKPRVLKVDVAVAGEDRFSLSGAARKATRYVAKLDPGGLLGVVAPLVGKAPPDLKYWMSGDPIPTFVRVDAPFYPDGPIWCVELSGTRWSR